MNVHSHITEMQMFVKVFTTGISGVIDMNVSKKRTNMASTWRMLKILSKLLMCISILERCTSV